MRYLLLLFILCSCSDIEQSTNLFQGQHVILSDGREVIIDTAIPGGYIVYIPNKLEIKFFSITESQIKSK